MKLQSLGAGVLNKRMNPFDGFPDLLILEPRREYHGLLLEIKRDDEKLLNKKGKYKTPHLEQQSIILHKLSAKKYYTSFGIGFDNCKEIIEKYLKLH